MCRTCDYPPRYINNTGPASARQRPNSLMSQQHGTNWGERARPAHLTRGRTTSHHPSGRSDLNHVLSSSKSSSVNSRGTSDHCPPCKLNTSFGLQLRSLKGESSSTFSPKSSFLRIVGATGFEPATSRTRTVRLARLSYAPRWNDPFDHSELAGSVNRISSEVEKVRRGRNQVWDREVCV